MRRLSVECNGWSFGGTSHREEPGIVDEKVE